MLISRLNLQITSRSMEQKTWIDGPILAVDHCSPFICGQPSSPKRSRLTGPDSFGTTKSGKSLQCVEDLDNQEDNCSGELVEGGLENDEDHPGRSPLSK